MSRVVSPEISSGKFPIFPEISRNDFTGNFVPLITFQLITVNLLTVILFKGFIAPVDYSSVYLIILCTLACFH